MTCSARWLGGSQSASQPSNTHNSARGLRRDGATCNQQTPWYNLKSKYDKVVRGDKNQRRRGFHYGACPLLSVAGYRAVHPAIMRRLLCLLWCPNGRFVYRTKEDGNVDGTWAYRQYLRHCDRVAVVEQLNTDRSGENAEFTQTLYFYLAWTASNCVAA